ncbi:hypothetical protein BDA99DRAFT_328254 [Phascolomyces articulosus]|uniref:Uncharacterized protein n=1 Tax=Phascolomyces articulosus TaxID=60185 RepID=A0AAD5K5X6_9FUNG|nr:hypothetical protein BDA99DRAFT_328254 [Phascolomyces articulosus]
MSLDSAIDYLHSKATTFIKLTPPSKTINNLLMDATSNNHKQKKLVRDAEPHECQLYAINEDDAVPGRRHTVLERPSLIGSGGPRDIDRLLIAATNLNKVCNVPDIQEIIERFRQEQDTHQIDLDYLNATYNENKIEIERLMKAAKRKEIQQQKHKDPMDIDPEPDNESIKEAERQAQLERELKDLELKINQKKEELRQSSEELYRCQEATEELTSQVQQQPESVPATDPISPPLMDTNGSFSNLQSSFQEILENPTTSYADKLSTIRRELLRIIMADQNTAGVAKVMAKVIQLLEEDSSHRILLDDLKQSATEYANGLKLSESAGNQAIYKLNAYKLVIIDRREEQSFVQLV